MQIVEENGFRLAYDPEVPALSVDWGRQGRYALTHSLDDARHVDYGHDGQPVAVEFLYTDRGVDLRGVPRAAEFAPLLERVGVPIAHPPEPHDPGPPLGRAVAEALVSYRARHGLSGRALAHRLGMQQPTLVRLERGERTPSLETLERLAAVIGLHVVLEVLPAGGQEPVAQLPGGMRVVADDTGPGGGRRRVAVG